MAFIDIVEPNEAAGRLKEIYNDLEKSRGKIAEVHKIQSLNPESIVRHMDLYMTVMFGKSPLKRYQREMLGVVVSSANDCEYCQLHHGEALNHYWKDKDKIRGLRKGYSQVDLDENDQLLCMLAVDLTRDPTGVDEDYIRELKNNGCTDRELLDATLVISYFNFVNRVVMGLGVETSEEEAKGYKY